MAMFIKSQDSLEEILFRPWPEDICYFRHCMIRYWCGYARRNICAALFERNPPGQVCHLFGEVGCHFSSDKPRIEVALSSTKALRENSTAFQNCPRFFIHDGFIRTTPITEINPKTPSPRIPASCVANTLFAIQDCVYSSFLACHNKYRFPNRPLPIVRNIGKSADSFKIRKLCRGTDNGLYLAVIDHFG